jgi:hypothetical protein
MKIFLLFVLGCVFYSCTPGACGCLEIINDKQSRLFGNSNRTSYAKRMQSLAEAKMREECD